MTSKSIYLDYAATTPVIPEVLEAMLPYFSEQFGNPNSSHTQGLNAKKALDKARSTIASILNCEPAEIIFTGGGTESNNLAIFGTTKANRSTNKHILTSNIEHSSVDAPLDTLKNEAEITKIPVQNDGILAIEEIEKNIQPNTVFASFIYANNEIGVVQNIPEISKLLKSRKIVFHTDACQAAGYEEVDTKKLGVDLMTLNAGKIYGPKGVGLLYIKAGTPIAPLIYGGGQEFGIRSGTPNIPGIVGLAKALEIATTNRSKETTRLSALRDHFISELTTHIPGSKLNGHKQLRLANNISITIPGIPAREMVLHLDTHSIAISSGSACSTGKQTPSHVLKALGLSDEKALSTLRITMGHDTTKEDLSRTLDVIINITKQLT